MHAVRVADGRWTLFVEPTWPGFRGHFPGRPLLPAAEMMSLASEVVGAGPAMLIAARFLAPVLPGDRLVITKPKPDRLQIQIHRDDTLVADLRWRD